MSLFKAFTAFILLLRLPKRAGATVENNNILHVHARVYSTGVNA